MSNFPEIIKGTYRHSKTGNLYSVQGIALQTETEEPLVIYRPLYDGADYEMFARPYAMFMEEVEVNGEIKLRFEKVSDHV